MSLELRHYQKKAVEALFDGTAQGHPLVVLPTGTGKSLVIADFCRSALEYFPTTRIIIATHVKELVAQNYAEFDRIWPFAPAGVYSAGLNRRDTDDQILFCGIQSAYRRAYDFQRCDLLLIDEAHTIPKSGEGMWRTFIKDLTDINPDMKVCGLTATDFRMDSGSLTQGKEKLFTHVAYEYGILEALKDGYLCPVIPKHMATIYDVSSVEKRGGEYVPGALEKAVNIDSKTKAAIDEVEQCGQDRKSWLIFSSGNAHAEAIHAELKARGYKGECVTQETDRGTRDRAVRDIRAGNIRYIVNNRIFTTGFNAPNIDLLVDLGPTQSAGLHVQKIGRGMRLCDGKTDCLLLDFARNTDRHGPLDQIRARKTGEGGNGQPPVKVCEKCHCTCFAGVRFCPDCGNEFPAAEIKIQTTASKAPVVSTQIKPEWLDVMSVYYSSHTAQGKTVPVMKVTYTTWGGSINEYVCFEHQGFAREKAVNWHRKRLPELACPRKVEYGPTMGYPKPSRILARRNGKFWDVLDAEFPKVENEVEKIDDDSEPYEIPF